MPLDPGWPWWMVVVAAALWVGAVVGAVRIVGWLLAERRERRARRRRRETNAAIELRPPDGPPDP